MKVICVPKDLSALYRLNYDLSEPGDLIEIYLEDYTFTQLTEGRFFYQINTIIDSNIDEFEDESIAGESEIKKILYSNIFENASHNKGLKEIIPRIKDLFQEALNRGTGIFFYF